MAELTPKIERVYDYVRSRAPEKISRRDVADDLRISYGAARYRLDRLVTLGRLDVDKIRTRTGWVRRVWYLTVVKFVHYTVVGTFDTKDKKNTRLRASVTLDYDVEVDKDKEYYKKASRKINDWILEMFGHVEIVAKISSETSRTLKSVADELLEEKEEVTDIGYDWNWSRAGTTDNKEKKIGFMTWDEMIPLGISGGWTTLVEARR